MAYQYDLPDFKLYLNSKNSRYRVDGLIFWQNRIPLPIDLFNRIFDDADVFVAEYVRQVTASAIVFKCSDELHDRFGLMMDSLPSKDVLRKRIAVTEWVEEKLRADSELRLLSSEVAEILGLDGFELCAEAVVASLAHQGKKYTRLFMPQLVRKCFELRAGCDQVGSDNTDMFGNIIADRYNIYRSGFSDALAIIFNALLEFKILCSGRGSGLQRLNLIVGRAEGIDVRSGQTTDGSLWEPGYDDDHFVTLNIEHPLLRNKVESESLKLAELLYYLSEFENNQYSDTQRKLLENMRQEVSRGLWIRHDS